jgi:hypothetical protein
VIELSATNLAHCCYDGQKPGPLENKILSCVGPALLQQAADELGPHSMVLGNLANATACLGLQEEAVAIARRAINLAPEAVSARRALCNTLPPH